MEGDGVENLMCEDGECEWEISVVTKWEKEANATAHSRCCLCVGFT